MIFPAHLQILSANIFPNPVANRKDSPKLVYLSFMQDIHFLAFRSSRIAYTRYGRGGVRVICLHGYSESCRSFNFFAHLLPESFTILAFDLPFHGLTQWNEGLDLKPADLWEIILMLEPAVAAAGSRFQLLGFSMGGRIALSLMEYRPEKIEKLILLAPDGLHTNFWYRLATQSRFGNWLFKTCMNSPQFFFRTIMLIKRSGLLNDSVHGFVINNLRNAEAREELYMRWTSMRWFTPRLENIILLLRKYQIPVVLFYGEHDRIIKPGTGRKMQAALRDLVSLYMLPCGHRLLQEKQLVTIIEKLTV